ncbi:hypothetical protein SCLCIDRAFT_146145, partial [Scleroderma citrinum Foug A]
CSIPVFEDLLPEPHNGFVMKLLFLLCHMPLFPPKSFIMKLKPKQGIRLGRPF